jgi:hypothetical protein
VLYMVIEHFKDGDAVRVYGGSVRTSAEVVEAIRPRL